MLDAAPVDDTGLLTASRAFVALRSGDVACAVRLGAEVLETPGAVPGRPLAAAAAGIGLAVAGRSGEALIAVTAGLDTLGEQPDGRTGPTVGIVALAQARIVALLHAGRIHELTASATEMYRSSLSAPESARDSIAALHRGGAALVAGRIDAADRWLVEARDGLRRCDPLDLTAVCIAWLATARALLGRPDAASDLLGELDDDNSLLFRPHVRRAQVWIMACRDHPVEAAEMALDEARGAAASGQYTLQAGLLHDAVRLGRAAAAAAPLRRLADELSAPLVSASAEHADGVVDAVPERIEAAGMRFEELGALLLAADEPCGSPTAAATPAPLPWPDWTRHGSPLASVMWPRWPRTGCPTRPSPAGTCSRYGPWRPTWPTPTPSWASAAGRSWHPHWT